MVETRRRRARFVPVAVMAGAALAAGCSAKHDPAPGAILVAIDTNLKVPDDLDGIGLAISDSKGTVSEDVMYTLGTGVGATFPATFAVIRGTSLPVTVRVVGYKGDSVVTVREATTTLPDDRTALLHLDLDYLNEGMVTGTASQLVSKLTTTCAAGTTPIGGTCQAITLDSLSLPDYKAAALGSSTDAASAIDVDQCYVGGSSLTPTSTGTACTVPVPGASVNFGLTLPAGSAGWCNGASCVVPIPSVSGSTPGDGWNLDPDGTIHLPQGVCDKGLPVFTTPVTSSCPAFSLQHPAHQDYGAIVDSDSGVLDGGSGVTPRSDIASMSVDDTGVYVVSRASSAGTVIEKLPLDFAPGQRGTMVTVPYDGVLGTSAVHYPYIAVPVTNSDGPGATMLAIDMTDASTPRSYGTDVDPSNVALATGADGGTFLLYIDSHTAGSALRAYNVAGPGDASAPIANNTPAYGIGAIPGDGGSFVAFSGGQGQPFYAGIFPDLTEVVPPLGASPNEVSFVGQRLVWTDNTGSLHASGSSADAGGVLLTDGGISNKPYAIVAGADGRVFWVSSAQTIYEAQLGDGGFTTTPAPANVGSAAAGVTSLAVHAGTLYWTDTTGVYRQALTAIP